MCVSRSVMANSATTWAIARQAPLSVNSPGKNTGMGCHSLLQEIFLTLGSNLGLPHCRQIFNYLSSKGLVSCEPEVGTKTKYVFFITNRGFPDSSVGKESICNAGDPGLIPRLGRSAGEGIGYPLQYSWASLVAQLVKNSPAMWET